jgi:hypothetical protein
MFNFHVFVDFPPDVYFQFLSTIISKETLCDKYAHLSKIKEWTQRHVEYSESETLMAILQDPVPEVAETPEAVTIIW